MSILFFIKFFESKRKKFHCTPLNFSNKWVNLTPKCVGDQWSGWCDILTSSTFHSKENFSSTFFFGVISWEVETQQIDRLSVHRFYFLFQFYGLERLVAKTSRKVSQEYLWNFDIERCDMYCGVILGNGLEIFLLQGWYFLPPYSNCFENYWDSLLHIFFNTIFFIF